MEFFSPLIRTYTPACLPPQPAQLWKMTDEEIKLVCLPEEHNNAFFEPENPTNRFRRGNMLRCSYNKDAYNCSSGINYYDTLCPDDEIPFFEEAYHNMTSNSSMFDGCEQIRQNLIQDGAFPWFLRVEQKSVPLDDYDQIPDSNGIPYHLLVQMGLAESSQDMNEPLEGYSSRIEGQRLLDSCHSNSEYEGLQFDGNYFGIRHPHKSNGIAQTQTLFTGQVTSEMVRSKYFDDLDELPEPGFIGKYSRRYDSDAESSRNTADSRTTLSDIFLREEAASSTKSQQPNFHRNRSKIDFEKWKIESKPQCISSIRNEDSESTYPASNSPTESQSTITQLFSVFDQDDQIANRSAKEREIVKTHGTPVDSIRNSEMQTAKTDSTPEPHSLSDLNEHDSSKDAASPKNDTPLEGKQIDEVSVTTDGKIQTEDVQLMRKSCSPKIVGKCKTLDNDNGGPQSEEEIGGKIDENTNDEMFQARPDPKTVDLPVDADNLLDVKAVENGDNLQKEVAALENKDDDERWSISDMLQDEDADQPGNEKDLAESKDDDEDDRWTISDLLLDLETPKETEQSDILENGGIPQNCESPKNIDARSSANQDDRQAIEDILPDDFDFGSEVEETFQVFQSQYFELCPTDNENISTNLESSKNIAKPECKTRMFDTSIKLDEDLPWKTHIRQNVLDRAAEIARRGQIEPTDDPLVVSLYFENSENNPVQKEQWTNHRARMECDVRLDDGKVIFDRFMVEIESTCNEQSQMSEDMFQSLNLGENEIKPSGSLENGTEERMGGLTEDGKNFANLGPSSRRNVQESHLRESTLDAHEMNEASPLSGKANEEDKVRRINFDDKDPEKLDGMPDRLQAVTSSPEPSKKVIHPDNVGAGFVSKDSQIEPLAAQSSTAPDESLKMSNGRNLQTCRQQSGSQDSLSSTHDAPQIETLMVHPTIEDIPGAAPKSCSSADHPGFENSISTARVMVSDKRLPESEATINSTGKSPGKVNVQEKSKSLVTPPKDAENPESFLGKKFTSKPTSPPSDSSARPKSKTSSTTKITGGVLGSNLVMAQLDNPSQPPLEGSVVEAFSTKENLLNVPEVHIVPKEAITHSRTDGSSHSGMQDTISCHESSRCLPFVSNTIVDSPTKVDSHRTAIAQTTNFGDSRNTSLDSPQNASDPKDPTSDDPKPVTGRPSVRNSSLSEETVMKMYTEIFNADARTSDVDISLMNALGPNKALHSCTLKNFELDATSDRGHQDGVYQFLKTPVTEEIVPHQSPSPPSRKRHLQRTIFGSPPAKKIGLQDQKITNFFPSVKMMNTDGSMDQFFDAPCTYDTLTDHKTQLFHQIDAPRKRKTPIVEILKSIDVIDEGRQSSRLSNVTYHRKYEFNNLPPGSVTSMDQYKRYTKNNSSGPIQVSRSLNVDEFDRFPLISHQVTDGNHEIIDLKEDKVEKTATRMESIGDLVEIGFTICYKEKYSILNRPLEDKLISDPIGIMSRVEFAGYKVMRIFQTVDELGKENSRSFLLSLLFSNCRKVCFEAQALIILVLDIIQNVSAKVVYSWHLLDHKIGMWLLDPEHPIDGFPSIMANLGMQVIGIEKEPLKWLGVVSKFMDAQSRAIEEIFVKLSRLNLWDVFEKMETALVPILAYMEQKSIKVDYARAREISEALQTRMSLIEKEAWQLAGKRFSLRSPAQLRRILYDDLKLDKLGAVDVKTTAASGAKTTDEGALKQLTAYHPLPALILEYRRAHKIKTTYIDGILQHVIDRNYVSTSWEQCATSTGRITSNKPNLQSIPKREEDITINGKSFNAREIFVARPGHVFIAVDFQQIEMRVFAHLARDKRLIAAFDKPEDIFSTMTQMRLGTSEFEPAEREKTKTVMYALFYGAGVNKIAEMLSISKDSASQICYEFYALFPSIKNFRTRVLDDCRIHKELRSLSGRRRLFLDIATSNDKLKYKTERTAVNFTIQGSAADIFKAALIRTELALRQVDIEATLLLQIHDELLWEVGEGDKSQAIDIIKKSMESTRCYWLDKFKLKVNLPIKITAGYSWGRMS